jgi:epoxide hydrolase 4
MDSIATLSVPLPGLRMQALQAGPTEGPLVLLLHGFPELSESWREVLPRLAEAGFRAVAPDLRGYGGTERPARGYDLDTLVEDIAHLAGHLQPGRPVHLVGHDWGGVIACHLAATRPELVDRLVVINAVPPGVLARHLWRPAQLMRSWYIFFFQLPYLPERLLSAGGGALVAYVIRRALVDPSRVPAGRLAEYEANFSRPEAAHAALAYYRQAFRGLLSAGGLRRREPPRIQAPCMLIWGEQDVALGKELTRELGPYFEQAPEVCYLPDVGHFVPLEVPERVAALILEHLGAGRPSATRAAREQPRVGGESPGESPPPH